MNATPAVFNDVWVFGTELEAKAFAWGVKYATSYLDGNGIEKLHIVGLRRFERHWEVLLLRL